MNVVLLVINGLIIAATYALSKSMMVHNLAPITLLMWQVVPSAIVVYGIAFIRGQRPGFHWPLLRYYLIAGLLGVTVPYMITYQVLQYLPTGVVGVAGSLSAVMTYAFARIANIEKPGLTRLAGLILGLTGVLAIILPKGALPAPGMAVCVLVALLAPLSLAGGNVFRSVYWPKGGKPLTLAAGMLVTQSIVAIAVAVTTGSHFIPPIDHHGIGTALAALGIMSTVFYLTAFELQKRTEPVFISQMGYVISLGSLLIGILFLGEQPSPWVWTAAAVIVGGIALAIRKPSSAIANVANH